MKIINLILLCLILSSCTTTLKYTMNNSKFLTPETKGKFLSGDVGLSYQLTNKVVLESAFDPLIFNTPIVLDLNYITTGFNLSLPINLGLLERLDFYSIDSKYGFKYQFIGDPAIKRTEEYKAAIALGYGVDKPESGNIIYNGSSTRTYNTSIKIKSYETSILIGKRVSEKSLLYTNLFYDYYNYNGDLTSSQFSPIHAEGHSYNAGALFGYELSNKDFPIAIIRLEGGVAVGRLDNTDSKTSGAIGASASLGW